MITIEREFRRSHLVQEEALSGMTFTGEDGGHKFIVHVKSPAGEAETLTGSVVGKFVRADGVTVELTAAEDYAGIENGAAWVVLAANCYTQAGPFRLTVTNIASDETRTTVCAFTGYVRTSETDAIVDPENVINVDAIVGMIDEMEDATEAAQEAASFVNSIIAPSYSTSLMYAVGDYCTYNGAMYRCTTATDGAFNPAHWEAVKVGSEFQNVDAELGDLKSAFETGYTSITSADLEVGGWDETGNKISVYGNKAVRTKQAYPVKAGDYIETVPGETALYWTGMVISNGTVVESWGAGTYRASISNSKRVFTADGNLVLIFANGYNPGNSTSINPADMTATVKLYTSNIAKTVEGNTAAINSVRQDTQYIFTEKVDETETASSATFFYLPCRFEYGQTYVVKLTFSAFSSSTTRKYSLRTTTARYTSSTYVVQMVATINNAAPVVGDTYEYRFVADRRASGAVANFLAFEMSVNAESVCHVEVYSIKAEDNAHKMGELDYLTASDIVSLNHDAPQKILNGLKPFGRDTTAPLSLLHFSDIHAAQTNLGRIVAMGESLGTNIDDIICTGDMVSNNYSATSMDFWNAVDGAENILMVVGNHDLADGSHGYSSDQIGQAVAYQTYFSPYVSNWGVTMAGENLTYWYKDYATKNVRLIGLNYLLTGDASAAQKTWLAARLAEAKTAGYAVVIAEHSPLNSFTQIDCNFNIIGKSWGYAEVLADFQSAVQDFIDDGGEFACYIAGHSHCDYVGYNSNYPDQLCIVVTTATTSGLNNDQRRVAGEKSQDAANVVLVDTVTKTVKLVRIGADMDTYLRGRDLMTIRYTDKTIIAQS